MNIQVNKTAFLKALTNAVSIVKNRVVQPILNGVYLNAEANTVFIASTDLDCTIIQELGCITTLPGQIVIEGPKDVIKQLKAWPKADRLDIVVSDDTVSFKQGMYTYNTGALDAQDFPNIGTGTDLVDNLDYRDMDIITNKIAFAASTYDYCSILNAVNIQTKNGSLDAVATDGSRLAHYQSMNRTSGAAIDKHNINIPAATFKTLAKVRGSKNKTVTHLRVGKGMSGHMLATFEGEGFEVTVRLIQGDYPHYSELFPKSQDHYTIANRQELIGACKSAIAQEPRTMLLTFEGLALKGHGTDTQCFMHVQGQASDDTKFALNGKYLLDFISQFDTETVKIERQAALKPMIITEHDVRYLIMPVQTK